MQLDYQQAVVSFCYDLTDPSARSVPIGILVVGELKGSRTRLCIAGVASRTSFPADLDPVTRDMLRAVPRLLKAHVSEAFGSMPPATPLETILHRLYDGLRNSLHVAEIGTVRHMDLGAHDDEAAEVEAVTWAMPRVISEAFKAIGVQAKVHVPRPSMPPPSPELSVWPIRRPPSSSREMHA